MICEFILSRVRFFIRTCTPFEYIANGASIIPTITKKRGEFMIKGCERRMIKIENPESELFESAYFILRQNAPSPKKCKKEELLREAVRITDGKLTESTKKRKKLERIVHIVSFAAGVFVSAAAFGLILLIR